MRLHIVGTEPRIESYVNEHGWYIRMNRDGRNFELYEVTPMDDDRLIGIFGDLIQALQRGIEMT